MFKNMGGCKFLPADSSKHHSPANNTFSLPTPLPNWPQEQGFGTGIINLGEIEVTEITSFEFIWGSHLSHDKRKCVSFYKPIGIPEGFFSLGHYCQPNKKPMYGYVLAAKDLGTSKTPALAPPCDFTLIWNSDDNMGIYDPPVSFWLPESPPRYKAMGFLVSNKPEKPNWADIMCVREDLVDDCQSHDLLLDMHSKFRNVPFKVWKTRPCDRGMLGRGVSTGTFSCGVMCNAGDEMPISCLKNFDPDLRSMPNLDQIHTLIHHYGPTVFFHPKETYLPSSVSWFFRNGARLCKAKDHDGEPIDPNGSNLPGGGGNDGEFWLDIPNDDQKNKVKHGDIESAQLYVHVKPAFGGTFTDIAMWIFYPFNGPATFKIGPSTIPLGRTGEHIGDWEHFTLRISNFAGRLQWIYFSQHSSGAWVDASNLEYIDGNRAVVYASKSGHASYPHPGTYLQGSSKLGIGIRNDCSRSKLSVDSSTRYQVVAAEYLGSCVTEPCWLQFMREWGPKIVYKSRKELDKVVKKLPLMIRGSIKNFFNKFPAELSGEEGPTGPKEKNNWYGDERW